MNPVLDPARLRGLILALPDEGNPSPKAAVRALFKQRGWSPLTDPWESDALYAAACEMRSAAEDAGFVAWAMPIDTAPLIERVGKLPDDLKDLAADNAAGCPTVNRPDLWTEESWATADEAISAAEATAAKRLRHVMAILGDLNLKDDDARHAAVKTLTHGRSESAKALTAPEVAHLASIAEGVKLGMGDGTVTPFTVDWKAEAKRFGTTLAALVKEGNEWAKAKRLPFPSGSGVKCLDSIPTVDASMTVPVAHRIIAHLIGTADAGETMQDRSNEVKAQEAAIADEIAKAAIAADEANAEPEPEVEVEVDDVTEALSAVGEGAEAVADLAATTDLGHAVILARVEAMERRQEALEGAVRSVLAAVQEATAAVLAAMSGGAGVDAN